MQMEEIFENGATFEAIAFGREFHHVLESDLDDVKRLAIYFKFFSFGRKRAHGGPGGV